MDSERANGTGKSSAPRVLFRISAGFLKIVLNVVIYGVVAFLIYKGAIKAYDFAYDVMGNGTLEEKTNDDESTLVDADSENGDAAEGTSSDESAKTTKIRRIRILQGESVMNIAAKLETNKIIKDKYSFFVRAQLNSLGAKNGKGEIQAGTYELNPTMTYKEILDTITNYEKSIEASQTVDDVESTP